MSTSEFDIYILIKPAKNFIIYR